MNHLTDERIVDALEGALPDREAVHLRACAACEARVERLRGVLHDLPAVDVPEPSPLFWNHFGAQVNASVDAAPKHRSRWLTTAALAWMGAAAVVILAVIGLYESSTAKLVPPVGITQAPIDDAATAGTETPTDPDVETDEAWAVVRSFAADLHYDDAQEAGVVPRPGSLERAATELSTDERAELVRLIEEDLKRRGA
jgi:hypothetical protein